MTASATPLRRRLDRRERERIVLDTAARLFYARGVHEVGMDELVKEAGLSKPTVYRLFPTKDALIGAYLERLARQIFGQIDTDIERLAAKEALIAVVDAVELDIQRAEFRGCPFNNASIEYDDPEHPARIAARKYRLGLHQRLDDLAQRLYGGRSEPGRGLGGQLAVLIDGAYTSAAHLGANGPAAAGLTLARSLVAGTGVAPRE